jgi:hypothetical protein
METKDYKCGPNFFPAWLFNEPQFGGCCNDHDLAYDMSTGKFCADLDLLKCMWGKAGEEIGFGWKLRAYVQAVLSFLLVILLPYSYVVYLYRKIKNH